MITFFLNSKFKGKISKFKLCIEEIQKILYFFNY